MKKITVLLAEDHDVVREGLRLLLELNGNFDIVGEAKNGNDAILLAQKFQPNVIVMDIAMPILNGFEATRKIRFEAPDSKILILSAHADDEYVERMLAEGVAGYLIKQNSGQVLIKAIQEIAKGQSYFSPSIAKRQRDFERRAHEHGSAATNRQVYRKLTAREAEVLQLVAEGNANKQIASLLGISIKTVEKHRQQVMDKLNIHETAGLTRHAIATGVIESCAQETTE